MALVPESAALPQTRVPAVPARQLALTHGDRLCAELVRHALRQFKSSFRIPYAIVKMVRIFRCVAQGLIDIFHSTQLSPLV
jgi:hypothetical protein